MVSKEYREFLASRKGKPTNVYAVQKKALAEYKTIHGYNANKRNLINAQKTEQFEQTRGGKFLERMRGGIARAVYNVEPPKEMSNKNKLKLLKIQLAIAKEKTKATNINNFQQVQTQRAIALRKQQSATDNYDWMFSNFSNPKFDMAGQVEREIASTNGLANEGDNEANRINRIVSSVGSFQHNLPTANVNREAMALANFQHNLPMFDIDREVNSLSVGQHNKALFDVSREADLYSYILSGKSSRKKRK